MSLEEMRKFLLPVKPETDPGFRAEVERLGRRGLVIIGWVELVMSLLGAIIYQLTSAVFSSLLHLATGRAGAEGSIQLRTQRIGPTIEAAISDSGPALPPREITRLFDPGSRVFGGRVTTGDWNLFVARRLVHEAGGDIASAGGNKFLVTLPCPAERV